MPVSACRLAILSPCEDEAVVLCDYLVIDLDQGSERSILLSGLL